MLKTKQNQAAQVYFPVESYLKIKQVAKKENKAIAAWIREAVEEKLEHYPEGKSFSELPTFDWCVDPATSQKIDEIVYLKKK